MDELVEALTPPKIIHPEKVDLEIIEAAPLTSTAIFLQAMRDESPIGEPPMELELEEEKGEGEAHSFASPQRIVSSMQPSNDDFLSASVASNDSESVSGSDDEDLREEQEAAQSIVLFSSQALTRTPLPPIRSVYGAYGLLATQPQNVPPLRVAAAPLVTTPQRENGAAPNDLSSAA